MLAVEFAPAAANRATKMRHAGAIVLTEIARAGRARVFAHVARVPAQLGQVGEGDAPVDDKALDGSVESDAAGTGAAAANGVRVQAVHVSGRKIRKVTYRTVRLQ